MTTLLRESNPVARKAHQCQMCHGSINPGDTYRRSTYKYDNLYDFLTCTPCEDDHIVNEVDAWTGGWHDEGVDAESAWEWAHETVRHAKTDDLREIAARWLTRNACSCEACVGTGGDDRG